MHLTIEQYTSKRRIVLLFIWSVSSWPIAKENKFWTWKWTKWYFLVRNWNWAVKRTGLKWMFFTFTLDCVPLASWAKSYCQVDTDFFIFLLSDVSKFVTQNNKLTVMGFATFCNLSCCLRKDLSIKTTTCYVWKKQAWRSVTWRWTIVLPQCQAVVLITYQKIMQRIPFMFSNSFD